MEQLYNKIESKLINIDDPREDPFLYRANIYTAARIHINEL